ncbi:MAG: hypothetical protein M3498_17300, partial [Deinococcota bacterium]|nr:hypothetical protein [Deinococcota bacterium]
MPAAVPPLEAVAEFRRLVVKPFWPGFRPLELPALLYDGEATWLFGHPRPPQGFEPLEGSEAAVFRGRHPSVQAHTAAEVGGVLTAVVMLNALAGASVQDVAAMMLHEAFHVFQASRYPHWRANEAELFTYPVEEAGLLRLQALEAEALRRASGARARGESLAWIRAFLELRRERFRDFPEGAARYERELERYEGLAYYLESLVRPVADGGAVPSEAVRRRFYSSGRMMANLLDRFNTGWKESLDAEPDLFLDDLLRGILKGEADQAALFTAQELEAAATWAGAEVARMEARRANDLANFLDRPGWILELVTVEPLWPQGFDPMNVRRLGGAQVLHTRFLALGNRAGTVEIMDRSALTEAAGAHPLFGGVRGLTVTGLEAEPVPSHKGGTLLLELPGLRVALSGATLEREGKTVTVT